MPYTFHNDPGHGWLEVPREEAIAAGILNRISEYSYQSRDGRTLYLEEDCDAALFVEARGLTSADFRDKYSDGDSFVRQLPHWMPIADRPHVVWPLAEPLRAFYSGGAPR